MVDEGEILRAGESSVRVGDDTSLVYMDAKGEITPQHYAFLVSEIEFDEIFKRIHERRLSYWADPGRHQRDPINRYSRIRLW